MNLLKSNPSPNHPSVFVCNCNTWTLPLALSKSLMNIRKRTGPKTDPRGTPLHTLLQLENEPSRHTLCHLLTTMTLSNFPLNHLYRVPSTLTSVLTKTFRTDADKERDQWVITVPNVPNTVGSRHSAHRHYWSAPWHTPVWGLLAEVGVAEFYYNWIDWTRLS